MLAIALAATAAVVMFGDAPAARDAAEPAPSVSVSSEQTPAPTASPAPEATAFEDIDAALSQLDALSALVLDASNPADDDFVRVSDWIPGIRIDLKYATCDNFTGCVIYDFSDAYLRYGTVKKLMAVQDALAAQGYGLLIWDAFRPVSAQFTLWAVSPNASYVANPYAGYSDHSRGNTVDLTIVDADGNPVDMPSAFDDFSARANRYYSDVSAEQAANAKWLTQLMTSAGFRTISSEWWHFVDTDSYPVATNFVPGGAA